MKYTTIIRRTAALIAAGMLAGSCTDWLSVQPEDQLLEKDTYASEVTINQALNGIYLKMAATNLYGFHMVSGTVETLAQYYWVPSNTSKETFYYLQEHNYAEQLSRTLLSGIWSAAYNTILDINVFIANLTDSNAVSAEKKNILIGEARALRAYIHLDMLRMFGPVYSKYPEGLSVPYYTEAGAQVKPRIPAREVMEFILIDINAALSLLANDPVIANGPMVGSEYIGDFYAHRNRRMNYFAVKALKARALMFTGGEQERTEAASLAREVLESPGFTDNFPWWTYTDISQPNDPDRVASSEVLFGIHNAYMYDFWNNNLSSGISSPSGLLAVSRSLVGYFIGTPDYSMSSDLRSLNWMAYRLPDYTVALKFSKTVGTYANFQPLIRKTELYYYIAEVEENYDMLNEVLTNRGQIEVDSGIEAHLQREWYSEFYGEGQLFFYLKRRALSTIKSPTNSTYTMTDAKWQPPVPQREVDQ